MAETIIERYLQMRPGIIKHVKQHDYVHQRDEICVTGRLPPSLVTFLHTSTWTQNKSSNNGVTCYDASPMGVAIHIVWASV